MNEFITLLILQLTLFITFVAIAISQYLLLMTRNN